MTKDQFSAREREGPKAILRRGGVRMLLLSSGQWGWQRLTGHSCVVEQRAATQSGNLNTAFHTFEPILS